MAGSDFANYDDPFLIRDNAIVRQGLTVRGLFWACTTSYFEFWHPVTWWSHMLDCQLFGLRPGLHHLTSVGFHVANTLLVFVVLRRLTGAVWRSALVAALFALHPLHVESVAWLAERKDVLSGFFFLLTLWTYVRYVEEARARDPGSHRWYRLSLVCFALGLMSKPMLVTLPFVLLLLDYWPLQRWPGPNAQDPGSDEARPTLWRLTEEKLPFFGLTLMSCAITFMGVRAAHNVLSAEVVPWSFRLANVPVSFARYLGKMIWPVDLTVLYPMPTRWELWQVGGATLAVLVISWFVLVCRRTAPYLIVGWLMFLGMLVPTIGVVPVGFQSIADRYTYLPFIGLFVAAVWGIADLGARCRIPTAAMDVASALVLTVCGMLTWSQVQHWQNSIALWTHCVSVKRENATAQYQLGHALQDAARVNEAITHYREALRVKPDHLDANLNLGVALAATGQLPESTNFFLAALRLKPDYAKAHVDLGTVLYRLGDVVGSTNHYAQALRTDPEFEPAHRFYAVALLDLHDPTGALVHAREAIRLDPRDAWAYTFQGRAASELGMSDDALKSFLAAVTLNPASADAHYGLGLEWLKRGKLDEAATSLGEALRINPSLPDAQFQMGVVRAMQGQRQEAVWHYRQALQVEPETPATLNNLAWLLATAPETDLRNGAEAVQLARRACERTANAQPVFIGTLAAAYAEAGEFEEAADSAQKACDLATSLSQTSLVQRNRELLERFKNRQPWREGR